MLETIIIAIVIGGLVGFGRLRIRARRRGRRLDQAARRVAGHVLSQELAAAIDVIDIALRDEDYRWLGLLTESRDLDNAWDAHNEAVWRAGHERWRVINDAVWAARPTYELTLSTSPSQQRESLALRRQQLVAATEVIDEIK